MPNRFDIFITRLETKSARNGVPSHPISDQHRVRRDKSDAKTARSGEAPAEKDHAKRRHKHDA
ncbi:hypothetical protein [Mesorhizobium sp.]|uniref:hypothetical protein n=1 Tax=Mesorhizobium sp. TaxID=1871066 RepID=UPI00121C4B66|nr:hypothetical protein [Mesorhizobium sp.]TIO05472.1 MAG: hypothetical protein E5X88_26775 [Mesorhizobium sp.]TIO35024.1 MAG: hypothetical protein E5X89_10900 [Mesorhizobium sp.]TIP12235.1 MAG: hypothetical protein E5X73_13940 [Mesorhizobium sp.]